MNKNAGQDSHRQRTRDYAAAATQQMELYCAARPGSPSAVRRPRLFVRSELWIALLGPSLEEGIVGIGPTVAAALRAFDTQYLAGLRPPIGVVRDLGALDQRLKKFAVPRRRGRNDKSDLNSPAEVSGSNGRHENSVSRLSHSGV
jgi:hypothetical protein